MSYCPMSHLTFSLQRSSVIDKFYSYTLFTWRDFWETYFLVFTCTRFSQRFSCSRNNVKLWKIVIFIQNNSKKFKVQILEICFWKPFVIMNPLGGVNKYLDITVLHEILTYKMNNIVHHGKFFILTHATFHTNSSSNIAN